MEEVATHALIYYLISTNENAENFDAKESEAVYKITMSFTKAFDDLEGETVIGAKAMRWSDGGREYVMDGLSESKGRFRVAALFDDYNELEVIEEEEIVDNIVAGMEGDVLVVPVLADVVEKLTQ